MLSFRKVALPLDGLDALAAEAAGQGFQFLHKLSFEWETGVNRFDGPGELLLGGFDADDLVAIGGLHCDPYLGQPAVARIRRVYVRAASRRQGIGGQLVRRLIDIARPHFLSLRLRAVTPDAARLYESLGFEPVQGDHVTHVLRFQNQPIQQL